MSDKARFLNFPLGLIAETIPDPAGGLNAIACFAFLERALETGVSNG